MDTISPKISSPLRSRSQPTPLSFGWVNFVLILILDDLKVLLIQVFVIIRQILALGFRNTVLGVVEIVFDVVNVFVEIHMLIQGPVN